MENQYVIALKNCLLGDFKKGDVLRFTENGMFLGNIYAAPVLAGQELLWGEDAAMTRREYLELEIDDTSYAEPGDYVVLLDEHPQYRTGRMVQVTEPKQFHDEECGYFIIRNVAEVLEALKYKGGN